MQNLTPTQYAEARFAAIRQEQFWCDIEHVTNQFSTEDWLTLASLLVQNTGHALLNRGKALGMLASAVGRLMVGTLEEIADMAKAIENDRGSEHFQNRLSAVSDFCGETWGDCKNLADSIQLAFRQDPKQTVVEALCLVGGFQLASGGLDGNGGIPDLDLQLGIEQHRSIFFHSVLAGVAVEMVVVTAAQWLTVLHSRLPENHASGWNDVLEYSQRILKATGRGASLGLAYHLAVDGLAQPAAYKDLPISDMPIEAHQVIFTTNALVEAISTNNIYKTWNEAKQVILLKQKTNRKTYRIVRAEGGWLID